MPARTPVDLGREHADCPTRFHGTVSAYVSGCTCPAAAQRRREYDRAYDRARREGAPPRRQDRDPQAVKQAIAGHFHAGQLTTSERKQVVAHLAGVRHMTDREIAVYLRWGRTPDLGRDSVRRFRIHHHIPAGIPATHQRTREAAAA